MNRLALTLALCLFSQVAFAATLEVRQDGTGDYTTLAAAVAAADPSDTIEITQWTTAYETGTLTIADTNLTITAVGAARVGNNVPGTGNHYKIQATASSSNTDHVFTNNAAGTVIDGIEILQNSTGTSDEGIRNAAASLTVKNSHIWADDAVSQQDGIYNGNTDTTIALENIMIQGFGRAGIHMQNYSGASTETLNVVGATIVECNTVDDEEGGAISSRAASSSSNITMYVASSILHSNSGTNGRTLNEADLGGTYPSSQNWHIEETFYGDENIDALDTDTNNVSGADITDSLTPGVGTWAIFADVTGTLPWNLTLVDDSDNDAQTVHSKTSFLSGQLTLPATDIAGTTRVAPYDVGAFEIEAAPPAGTAAGIILMM